MEVYPPEASRTLEGVSAHIKVTNGAGVPRAIELVASEFASASNLFHQSASAFTKN